MKKGEKMTEEQKRKISIANTGNVKAVGSRISSGKYTIIKVEDSWESPSVFGTGWEYEHRYVMEKHLGGKYLEKHQTVHHKNKNKHDNRIENLELMTDSEHSKIHYRDSRETIKKNNINKRLSRAGTIIYKKNKYGELRPYKWDETGEKLSTKMANIELFGTKHHPDYIKKQTAGKIGIKRGKYKKKQNK